MSESVLCVWVQRLANPVSKIWSEMDPASFDTLRSAIQLQGQHIQKQVEKTNGMLENLTRHAAQQEAMMAVFGDQLKLLAQRNPAEATLAATATPSPPHRMFQHQALTWDSHHISLVSQETVPPF